MKNAILSRLAIAATMALGVTTQAGAAGVFTIDPNAIPGGVFAPGPFNATLVNGTTSELLHMDSTTSTATASGWAQFSSFSNGATQLSPLVTGLALDYNLYLTFQLKNVLTSGTFGQAGSSYAMTQLDFQVWADKDINTTFTFADAATATEATVNGTKTDDIFLAAGSLITGVAGFDALGGAFINAVNAFAVCTGAGTASVGGVIVAAPCADGTGAAFFAQPDPFYALAFSAFNNTTQGIGRSADGKLISITNAVGIVDFNSVPEPTSLALVGAGLLAAGASLRKRKAG